MRCTGCSEVIDEDAPAEVNGRGYFERYHAPRCRPKREPLIVQVPTVLSLVIDRVRKEREERQDRFDDYEPL